MVLPHSNFPLSGFIRLLIISKKDVSATGSLPRKAIFCPFTISKLTLLNNVLPSILLVSFCTFKIWLPGSLSGLNMMPGYFRLLGVMSSKTNLSNAFLREVACLLLEALALKRAMNSRRSFFFFYILLFLSPAWRAANWLLSYQNV